MGGIVADQVGYGKTAITLGLIDSASKINGPSPAMKPSLSSSKIPTRATLVIIPQHLGGQWPKEVKKFCGSSKKVVELRTVNDFNSLTVKAIIDADIVIANFTVLSGDKYAERLARLGGADGGNLPGSKKGGRHFDAIYKSSVQGVGRRLETLRENRNKALEDIEEDARGHRRAEQEAAERGDGVRMDKKKAVYKKTAEAETKNMNSSSSSGSRSGSNSNSSSSNSNSNNSNNNSMEVDEEEPSKKRKVAAATSAAVVVKAAKATKESLPPPPPAEAEAEAEAETSTDMFQPTLGVKFTIRIVVDNATHGELVETDHYPSREFGDAKFKARSILGAGVQVQFWKGQELNQTESPNMKKGKAPKAKGKAKAKAKAKTPLKKTPVKKYIDATSSDDDNEGNDGEKMVDDDGDDDAITSTSTSTQFKSNFKTYAFPKDGVNDKLR